MSTGLGCPRACPDHFTVHNTPFRWVVALATVRRPSGLTRASCRRHLLSRAFTPFAGWSKAASDEAAVDAAANAAGRGRTVTSG
jgi:hypothetical protein